MRGLNPLQSSLCQMPMQFYLVIIHQKLSSPLYYFCIISRPASVDRSVPLLQSSTRSSSLVSYALDASVKSLSTVTSLIASDASREEAQLTSPQRVISVELPLTYVQRNSKSRIFWKQGTGGDSDAENESSLSNIWHFRYISISYLLISSFVAWHRLRRLQPTCEARQ